MRSFLFACLVTTGGFFGFKTYFEPLIEQKQDTEKQKKLEEINAQLKSARDAYQTGRTTDAINIYHRLLKTHKDKTSIAQELGKIYKSQGKLRKALTTEFHHAKDEISRQKILREIDDLNKKMLNPNHPYGGVRYVIQPGETLAKIAKKFSTNERILKRINSIKNANLIHAGQAIKVIPVTLRCIVNLQKKELYAYFDDELFKVYPVGIGTTENPTPLGTFTVEVLLKDPVFYSEVGKKPIPSGDPRNPLGSRWLGFNDDFSSYGIHGTSQTGPIQQQSSKGCIRLTQEDVEELYDFADYGMTVTIE